MEKKGNRSSPSVRGPIAESKKDVIATRQPPRSGRRREATGTSLSAKPELSRKLQSQRIKTFDKRPKPRSSFVGRNEATGLDPEIEAELGSVFVPGSKKQSLNHLLNFTYASRDYHHVDNVREGSKNRGKLLTTRRHKYNKEHFLQANCQFIVNESGDYKQYLNNPDALVDWNFIEQVNVQVSDCSACPICLYPPVAAKMTRCGHIYCWSCVLHYLSLSDKPSRKCPICYEPVQKNDLKSVVAYVHPTFNINENITFKLMKRIKGSLIAYPANIEIKENHNIFNVSEKIDNVYSKLLSAKKQDILSIINREENELRNQLIQDKDCPEQCFIEQALVLLDERKNKVINKELDMLQECEKNNSSFALTDTLGMLEINEDNNEDYLYETGSSPTKCYYFYQASDGQHIYLHALNARMIEHTYGSLENGPKILSGKILEKEGGSMTEELRKKLRYLQHLPVTCQFEVAEIHLKQPVVIKETIEHFQEQIDLRRKRRQRRVKEEKRREKRIETEENRKLGKYPVPNIHIESNIQFPEFGFESRLRTESESASLPSERSSSPDMLATPSTSLDCTQGGLSFATMLATEKKRPPTWPTLKPTQNSCTPVKLINVTGSKMKSNISVPLRNDNDNDPEDFEPIPSYNQSFGDAIAQALEKAEKDEEVEDLHFVGKNKKKKKSKQKVLFTTSMACSGK